MAYYNTKGWDKLAFDAKVRRVRAEWADISAYVLNAALTKVSEEHQGAVNAGELDNYTPDVAELQRLIGEAVKELGRGQ
jgi:hypothetical protein